jgi:hypothetical protein
MRSIIPSTDRSETSIRLKNESQSRKALTALSLSLAVYGMAGWIYVAICGLVAPDTLHLPLTHLLPHLREDTSGVLSFIISFIGFLAYWIVRDNLCNLRPRWRMPRPCPTHAVRSRHALNRVVLRCRARHFPRHGRTKDGGNNGCESSPNRPCGSQRDKAMRCQNPCQATNGA